MDGAETSKLALNILYEFSRLNYSDIQEFVPAIKKSKGLGPNHLGAIFYSLKLLDMTKQWVCSKLFKDKCPTYQQKGNDHIYSLTGNLSDISVTVQKHEGSIDLKVRQTSVWEDDHDREIEKPKSFGQLINGILNASMAKASYNSSQKLALGNHAPLPFYYGDEKSCFMFGGQLPLFGRVPTPVKIAGEMFNGLPNELAKKVDRKGQLVTLMIEASVVKPKEYTHLDNKFL